DLSYFNVNHPRTDSQAWNATTLTPLLQFIHNNYGSDYGVDSTTVNTTFPPSRWAVYKWETAGAKVGTTVVGGTRKNGEPSSGLAAITASVPDRIPGAHTRITTKPTEEGRSGVKNVAECSAPTTKSGPDRRTLYVAVVNCCAQADQLSGGSRQV